MRVVTFKPTCQNMYEAHMIGGVRIALQFFLEQECEITKKPDIDMA